MSSLRENIIDHSKVRKKRLVKNIINTVLIKGIGILIGVLSLPLYIDYFNNQKILGVWLAILSILSWIVNFDLGIGNGLRNKLTTYINQNDLKKVSMYINSSYFIMSIIATLIISLGILLIKFTNVNTFFNIPPDLVSSNVLKLSLIIIFVGMVVQFLLKLIFSILYAIENISLPNLTILFSNLMVISFLFFIDIDDLNNKLLYLSLFNAITPNIILLLISIYTFKKYNFKIKFEDISLKFSKEVLTIGGRFFIIQVLLMFLLSTNEFLISWLYDSEFVVEYQIYSKWFLLIVTIFSVLSQPIWASISNAYAQRDFIWIKKINKKFDKIANLSILMTITLSLFFQKIVLFWLGNDFIKVDVSILLYFSFIVVSIIKINVATTIANAFNQINVQLYSLIAGALIKIVVLLVLYKLNFTWSSTLLSTSLSLLPLLIFQSLHSKKLVKLGSE